MIYRHHFPLTTIAAVVLVGCGSSVDIWTAAAHKPHKK